MIKKKNTLMMKPAKPLNSPSEGARGNGLSIVRKRNCDVTIQRSFISADHVPNLLVKNLPGVIPPEKAITASSDL